MLASQAIRSGDGDVFVAGGMENMNLAPYYLTKARTGYRMGNAEMIDGMIYDGLWCAFEKHHMGISAEWIAREYEVSRQAQDELAYESHRRALGCDGRRLVQGRDRTCAARLARRAARRSSSTPTRLRGAIPHWKRWPS